MYRVEYVADGYAMIVNESDYRSEWMAQTEAEGEQIAISLNKPEMLSTLADVRYQVETAPLELADGLQILTDRESRAEFWSTYDNLKNELIPDTDWKAANGWKVVTLAEMHPIAKAMAAHVRGCYAGERQVVTAIKGATTMVQIEAINIAGQFSQAYQAAVDQMMTAEPDA
ncbi:DUF4376 domain-containing protein [Pseudomonas sp. NPDC087358]|uniref:DUF4376 domain-containing protein n=1 Tax=Pseudomonas sp. NPDC087358 TaxID=3364439 RepID=UPI00384BC109